MLPNMSRLEDSFTKSKSQMTIIIGQPIISNIAHILQIFSSDLPIIRGLKLLTGSNSAPQYYCIHYTAMATDRNKMVENYCLEELKYCCPDQTEIWVAKHKVLKKNFTLKRVKFRSNQAEEAKDQQHPMTKQAWDYANVMRETNILKRLMCEMCPKCHKMIKTSNNVYTVYDQFPQTTIKDYLDTHSPNRQQKLALMLQLGKALSYFHTRAIIFLYLSCENVFIKERNVIFFSDWALARTADSQEKIDVAFFSNRYENLPTELANQGKYSYWTDIYCLGVIFEKIMKSGLLDQPSQVDKKVEVMIRQMKSEETVERPRLEEVLRNLQNYGANEMSQKGNIIVQRDRNMNSLKSISNFRIKHSASTPIDSVDFLKDNSFFEQQKKYSYLHSHKVLQDECSSPLFNKNAKSSKITEVITATSSRKIDSKKDFEIVSTTSMNYSRRKKEEDKVNVKELVKVINKKRNLAFFVSDLSEFVIRLWICPQLGYVLLKYALLTISTANEQWQKHKGIPAVEKQQVICILISERLKISSNLAFLKAHLEENQPQHQLKREFELQNQISDKYLKEKIIQFGKQMVIYCQKNSSDKANLQKLIECLFKTYMILKKIQQGTYQKFWQKIYTKDLAYLHSQKYLKDEKNLGHRYLKSRIAQILRGK